MVRVKKTANKKAKLVAKFASDKKGENIAILDMRTVSGICDWFVLVSAGSNRQVNAIAQNIEEEMSDKGFPLLHGEGRQSQAWVLLDYGDVVAHVFYDKLREFYGLERLWSDAPLEYFKEKCAKKTTKQRSRKSY